MGILETIRVAHDCTLPKDGLIKLHLGADFQAMGWMFEAFGGGNIHQVAAYTMAWQLNKNTNFKMLVQLIAQYLAVMPEPDIMWMRVYGDSIKLKSKGTMPDIPLPRYYGIAFMSAIGKPLGFGICLQPGTFGFEGHFLPNGDPQTGVVSIYGGMAGSSEIWPYNLEGKPLTINGKAFLDYQVDKAFKIETVEEV